MFEGTGVVRLCVEKSHDMFGRRCTQETIEGVVPEGRLKIIEMFEILSCCLVVDCLVTAFFRLLRTWK